MNVIFDLDGTLTDPAKGVVGCIRHALAAFRLGVPERCELERFIGPPLQDAFCELLAVDRDSKEVREAVAAYRERFAAIGMFENSVYEGIPEALASLVTRGARLFVATSKPRVFC